MPAGTAIARSVSTNALPLAGIVVLWALQVVHQMSAMPAIVSTNSSPSCRCLRRTHLYRSYPAAYALPLVGVVALVDSFFTSKGGLCSTLVVGVDSGMVMLWL